MADKIDQLYIFNGTATTLYDISLPRDAEETIFSLSADSYLEVGNPTAASNPAG